MGEKEEDKEATKRKAEDDKLEPVPVSAEKVAKLKEGQEETKEAETAEAEKAWTSCSAAVQIPNDIISSENSIQPLQRRHTTNTTTTSIMGPSPQYSEERRSQSPFEAHCDVGS